LPENKNFRREKMDENIKNQILEFIQNRHKKGESTASRHIHIRFDIEIIDAERILETLSQKNKISKYYDTSYQEDRYTSN
jgi:alpha-D-ribose 1-methylphosphonate 5-triphosphate diphosphatase PhnM